MGCIFISISDTITLVNAFSEFISTSALRNTVKYDILYTIQTRLCKPYKNMENEYHE